KRIMGPKKPPHRKQIKAPGRKPPETITKARTVRVDPDVWDIAMAHAVKLSAQRGYIVTLKESLGDIVRTYKQWEDQSNGENKAPPDGH
ncbi:MAG: hypothetical protein KA296_13800, partial [Marinobacter sp.]|nr:hypothetical protein [Marinobacter sp.]